MGEGAGQVREAWPLVVGAALICCVMAWAVWHRSTHVCVRSRPSICPVTIGRSVVVVPCDECLEYRER
jgi:hypothetical protein